MDGFILTEDIRKLAEMMQEAARNILRTVSSLEHCSVRATNDGAVEALLDDALEVIDAGFEVTLKGIK
jgi:hypothetical protein